MWSYRISSTRRPGYYLFQRSVIVSNRRRGVTSDSVPHTPAMLCASHTSSISRRGCTATLIFFRVVNLLSRGLGFMPSYRTAVIFLHIAIHVIDMTPALQSHTFCSSDASRRSSCSRSVFFHQEYMVITSFSTLIFNSHTLSVYAEVTRGV